MKRRHEQLAKLTESGSINRLEARSAGDSGCTALLLVVVAAAMENTMTLSMFSVESLAAHMITGNAGISTLPTTARLLGASLSAGPASMLMGRLGRRSGFAVGATLAVLGALMSAFAVQRRSFPLLLAGSTLGGAEGGFGGFLRFAAAEVVPKSLRARAISWTIAASVVAAVAGPHYAQLTRSLAPTEFVGTYLAVAALAVGYIGVVSVNSGLPSAEAVRTGGAGDNSSCSRRRSAHELLRQTSFLVALLAQVGGNCAMVFIMVTMPLAMSQARFEYSTIANVVTVHALGMYVPGFATGECIRRMRSARVLTLGALVYCVMVGVGLTVANDSSKASMSGSGSESSPMLSSEQWHLETVYSESDGGVGSHAGATKIGWLIDWRISSGPYFGTLLAAGIGWNLVFTSGSAMLVEVVPFEDRPVAQGLSESCAIGGSFVGTLASGLVWGASKRWDIVCYCAAAGPVFIVCVVALVSLTLPAGTDSPRAQ